MQMARMEAERTFSWQELGEKHRLCVVGKWVDLSEDMVLATENQQQWSMAWPLLQSAGSGCSVRLGALAANQGSKAQQRSHARICRAGVGCRQRCYACQTCSQGVDGMLLVVAGSGTADMGWASSLWVAVGVVKQAGTTDAMLQAQLVAGR